jgi:hypothetical protein
MMGDKMITSKKFRHKVTGEITTMIPLLEIRNYEEVNESD